MFFSVQRRRDDLLQELEELGRQRLELEEQVASSGPRGTRG